MLVFSDLTDDFGDLFVVLEFTVNESCVVFVSDRDFVRSVQLIFVCFGCLGYF